MRNRRTPFNTQNEDAFSLDYLHQGRLIKLAGIAQIGLDKNDRHFWTEAVLFADRFFLLANASAAGAMRHQHREFEHFHAVPQKARLGIDELEALKTKLRAAHES